MIGGYIGGIGTVTYVENGTTAYVTVTEDADTLTSAAVLALKATLDKAEDADTLTASATLKIVAAADITEDGDTLAALAVHGAVSATAEEDDTLQSAGILTISASLDAAEDGDTLTASVWLLDVPQRLAVRASSKTILLARVASTAHAKTTSHSRGQIHIRTS